MQFILMGVTLCGIIAAMLFVKSLDLGTGLTMALVLPLVLLAVYCLARVQTEAPEAEKDGSKRTQP